ncbi:MAG TPA: ABC transporter substrate-binding protein [Candidatus Limnocylindrales bacterium]|nr:ABC transporter substrate-binding protein [Candidatus Limnocylindrales bacterium]
MKSLRLLLAAVLVVAGCGSTDNSPKPSGPPSASSPPVVSAPPSVSTAPSISTATVRLALDWTPNTDHTGFFVARAKGLYRDAAIDLQILPYATLAPETLLATHQAECGISFQDSMTFAVAKGADIVSVAAILQKTASAIGVLADGPIQRPRDLDGKTYAGFGYPNEDPTLKFVIKADGGKGEFKTATLDAAAYEALYNHRADFTIPFTAWEGVEALQRGIGLRYFRFADYGFPEFYQVVLACDRQWLVKDPDAARRFVAATVAGFTFSARQPDEAAALLVSENPGVFDANKELPRKSQEFLVKDGYLLDPDGRFGSQTLERWQGYSDFLYRQGLLADADGKALTKPLDYARLFTNDFLP